MRIGRGEGALRFGGRNQVATEAERNELVWPEGKVITLRPVDDIGKPRHLGANESRTEARAYVIGEPIQFRSDTRRISNARADRWISQPGADAAERAIPECRDLNWLAAAWCDHPVVELCVHPGELATLGRSHDEAVAVGADAKVGAVAVGGDDVQQCWQQFGTKRVIARCRDVRACRLDVPERRINRVVLGHLVDAIREVVRQQPSANPRCKGAQHRCTNLWSARC